MTVRDRPTANTLGGERLQGSPSGWGQDKDTHSHRVYATRHWESAVRQAKQRVGIGIAKEEVKLSLSAEDIVL